MYTQMLSFSIHIIQVKYPMTLWEKLGYNAAITVLVCVVLYFLFKLFENWYTSKHQKTLYRYLLNFRNLTNAQTEILKKEIPFYNHLSKKQQKQFRHRVASFISHKDFVGRQGFEVTERVKLTIAGIACMITFGRKNYIYQLIDYVLIYPGEFYSTTNENYHKGEFNPKEKSIVFSWKDFESGYSITNDNFNLGIHEFMHALHIEAKIKRDPDSSILLKQFQEILIRLSNPEVKQTLDKTRHFRAYAFTNQYEFMAVLAEYFFESPVELRQHFPQLYTSVKTMLNMKFSGY